jgi:hypothetical protein
LPTPVCLKLQQQRAHGWFYRHENIFLDRATPREITVAEGFFRRLPFRPTLRDPSSKPAGLRPRILTHGPLSSHIFVTNAASGHTDVITLRRQHTATLALRFATAFNVTEVVRNDLSVSTGDFSMTGLTKRIVSKNGAQTLMLVLAASGMVAACKHNTTTTPQGLWVANGTDVLEYIPSQLAGGTSAAVPHLQLKSAALGAPQGVTFDKAGNLWVMDPQGKVNGKETPALFKFTPAQLAALAATPAPDPTETITYTGGAAPQQSVFDANGNQWVADHDANKILVFTATQMGVGGTNPTVPVVEISSAAFNGPLGIAFDSMGNLWVANNGGVMGANNTPSATGTSIVEFTAAHLPVPMANGMVTPTLTPDLTLSDNGAGSIQAPWALAFDAAGNLWSSNAAAPNTLVEFAKTSLAMTAAPSPAVTISPAMVNGIPSLDGPNGLCFNNAGNLAAGNSANAFGIPYFLKAQLVTGAPTPNTFIVGAATTLDAVAGCNFGPLVN